MHKQVIYRIHKNSDRPVESGFQHESECILGYWVQYGSCYGNTDKRQIWNQKQNGWQLFCYFKPKQCWATKRKIFKTKILWKQNRPGWKFGRIDWQNGKSTRKLNSTMTKSSIKCCKYFMLKYYCWECNKQKIAWTCWWTSWFMDARDVLKFSNGTRLWLIQFWELQNITRAHKSRNALESMRYPIHSIFKEPLS